MLYTCSYSNIIYKRENSKKGVVGIKEVGEEGRYQRDVRIGERGATWKGFF